MSPWWPWHYDAAAFHTLRFLADASWTASSLSLCCRQGGELLWEISLQWKEMENLGLLKMSLDEFDDRFARVYHCFKDAECYPLKSLGIRCTPQHRRWTWRVSRRAGSLMWRVQKDVFKFELLLSAKRLTSEATFKGLGYVQFEWLQQLLQFRFTTPPSVGWHWGM